MSPEEIAVQFREQELLRRKARLAVMANHEKLYKEPLTAEERLHDIEAIKRIREELLRQEKKLKPSYWQRLWATIRGGKQ